MRKRVKLAVVLVVIMLAKRVAAGDPEPHAHVLTEEPRLLCIPPAAERCIDLPPGHFVDRTTWSALDLELRRAQDAETRLGAENRSLRASAASWQPGWKVLAGAVVSGLALGWYVHARTE